MTSPCSEELLKSALAGDLPPEREDQLHRHLEECPACTTALEHMAGGADLWQEAAVMFAGDELDDALPSREEWSSVDFTVEHLEPSEEPGVLGRLGGYDVLEIIGRGGMSVVLKAHDRQLNRYIAIKVLAPHLAQSSLAKKRFAREAQAAAAVVHPNVMAIHQVQANGRLPFLVMPLVAGESLAHRLAVQGRLELKEMLRIGMQAAAGAGRGPRAGSRPPRREAVEHHAGKGRRAGVAHRLRSRPCRGRRFDDPLGRDCRHATVHVARTGPRRAVGRPQRSVQPGLCALRDGDRRLAFLDRFDGGHVAAADRRRAAGAGRVERRVAAVVRGDRRSAAGKGRVAALLVGQGSQ